MVYRRLRIFLLPLLNLAFYLLMPVLALSFLSSRGQAFPVTSATLLGVVSNGATGSPVVGARVTVNGKTTYSTSGGVYLLSVDPVGTFAATATKPGFDVYTAAPVAFQPGVTVTLNISLWETVNAPQAVTALLNNASQSVGISWTAPSGSYELIYDDGIQDDFTIWGYSGNMNAVKFTPAGFPVRVTGGSVNIGNSANYSPGVTVPGAFQVSIYDALGPGGSPGSSLAGPFTITPAATGWVEFTLPAPIAINSGSFYIVMIQVGPPPGASGIAIDETTPQFRSYSKFVTGGSPWIPAGGNFMIRAQCEGPGGPPPLSDATSSAVSCNIFRLRQGEEQNPSAWTLLAVTTATTVPDNSWPSLPCGPYRWGVKALYAANRWSTVSFSNIIGKCWTAPVTIHVNPSCLSSGYAGASVNFVNMAYPDTAYSALSDTTGIILFPNVWKGTYQLTITKFGYDTLLQTLPVTAAVNLNIILHQIKPPPANLVVNDSNLLAHWDVPHFGKSIFSENWSSGNLTHNGWTLQGGSNWSISSAVGNPAPCVIFSSLPHQQNYTQSLVSRTITGERSTLLKLKYDILLDNAGTTSVNQMAVELWNGNVWAPLKNYDNSAGSFPWTTEEIDISAYTNHDFRLRFTATGGDSFDINNWCVDNIGINATEPAQQQANCILGYYFYLGNVISGYTVKNGYSIPSNQVQYGQTYTACVRALYGSGYSDFSCTSFTSHFLYPVRNLNGAPYENVAYLAWEKPNSGTDTLAVTPPGLVGYTIYRDDSVIAHITFTDTLSFYDVNLEPGIYHYKVAAAYDLTSYGYPGLFAESVKAGPLDITINFGRQLPFFESWDHGTFAYNEWKFTPNPGNWVIDPNEGIPTPAASFRWQPPQVNYDFSLESPPFSGVPFTCAAIWLDFDLKLSDRNATGTEKFIVDVYYNHTWHQKAEIKNSGSIPWTSYHIDISPVRGKGFRIRFRAAGENSSEILSWCLDNISVYPVCYPATNLSALPAGGGVNLAWGSPACYGGNLLNEGFEEPFFPPAAWTEQSTNLTSAWSHMASSGPLGVHYGNFAAGLNWDYSRQDEWLIAHNIYVNGDLTFWSYAFQGSLHLDHYYVQVSSDQGASWTVLLDMSALPSYTPASGVNAWNTPYHIDLSGYAGETIDIAWHAVDGDGNGLWYPWAIDDCSIGAKDHYSKIVPVGSTPRFPVNPALPAHNLIGYDIYRKNGNTGNFVRINASPVSDTNYFDPGLLTGQYHYFVQSRFEECVNSTNSDTVPVSVITGIDSRSLPGIRIFPNPASDRLTISSQEEILEVKLLSCTGSLSGTWNTNTSHTFSFSVRGIAPGMYLLQVRLKDRVSNAKVCITSD